MLILGLVSSDDALCHAISEQLKRPDEAWQLAILPSLDTALAAWSDHFPAVIFLDCDEADATEERALFLSHQLEKQQPAPLLLTLGEAPKSLEHFGITEMFLRPLRLGYLMARLHFYARLLQQAPALSLSLGPWLFEPRAHTLTAKKSGEIVKLTDKETSLLEYLYSCDGPVSRDELLAAIWGYDANIDTHTLETHIYRLRRKLIPPQSPQDDAFTTESGGYQINPTWIKL